ncbi:MAG TPA: histone deacetylase [Burkholderiales bacterium]|nr:histone deacetylase [Burkholderiales bacterium]
MKPPRPPSRREFLRASGACLLAASIPALAQPPTATHVFHDPLTLKHLAGRQHPERPGRLEAVLRALQAAPFGSRIRFVESRPAQESDILLVHTRDYLELAKREVAEGRPRLSSGDTELSPDSLTAALAASGSVIAAVDAVLKGSARNAFCAVRPPGHHASAARGMGFCIFNNIAIGARHALRRHGLSRVLIADWDVHHGNGTQDLFWSDGSVLFFDTHQHPWYPGTGSESETGEGKAKGLIINRPFPAGAGRREILGAFREVLVPAAQRFRPELVMVSAGFDSRAGDPLGQFTLTDQDFADLTDVVLEIAARHAGGRLVSVLEGGYALDGLASAASAHVARLAAA